MKVQVATLFQFAEGTRLIGVFSDPDLAYAAGEVAIRDALQGNFEPWLIDCNHQHPKHRYFFAGGFTLTITEATVDERRAEV